MDDGSAGGPARGAQPPPGVGEIWVRQCTSCGRADLREWFPSATAAPSDPEWECQLCERSQWRSRSLYEMLDGRALDIG
jgi:hypothetical protein